MRFEKGMCAAHLAVATTLELQKQDKHQQVICVCKDLKVAHIHKAWRNEIIVRTFPLKVRLSPLPIHMKSGMLGHASMLSGEQSAGSFDLACVPDALACSFPS